MRSGSSLRGDRGVIHGVAVGHGRELTGALAQLPTVGPSMIEQPCQIRLNVQPALLGRPYDAQQNRPTVRSFLTPREQGRIGCVLEKGAG